MDRLYGYLNDNGYEKAIREHDLVLAQDGHLDKLSNLYIDKIIDDELKNVADGCLALGIRKKLRDKRLTCLAGETGKGELENENILQEIISKLKDIDAADDLSDNFAKASSRLLAWIVRKKDWKHLSDFPCVLKIGRQ